MFIEKNQQSNNSRLKCLYGNTVESKNWYWIHVIITIHVLINNFKNIYGNFSNKFTLLIDYKKINAENNVNFNDY